MPMWRCPHCGTPQAETARCWVCRRSSTTCSTCRHFRRSLAANVGWCGLDRRRLPLTGTELRGCWVSAAALPDIGPATKREELGEAGRQRRRFVPVETLLPAAIPGPVTTNDSAAGLPAALESLDASNDRATLFGEAEA